MPKGLKMFFKWSRILVEKISVSSMYPLANQHWQMDNPYSWWNSLMLAVSLPNIAFYPLVNSYCSGISPSLIGNPSSKGPFSIAMLDFRSVLRFLHLTSSRFQAHLGVCNGHQLQPCWMKPPQVGTSENRVEKLKQVQSVNHGKSRLGKWSDLEMCDFQRYGCWTKK